MLNPWMERFVQPGISLLIFEFEYGAFFKVNFRASWYDIYFFPISNFFLPSLPYENTKSFAPSFYGALLFVCTFVRFFMTIFSF